MSAAKTPSPVAVKACPEQSPSDENVMLLQTALARIRALESQLAAQSQSKQAAPETCKPPPQTTPMATPASTPNQTPVKTPARQKLLLDTPSPSMDQSESQGASEKKVEPGDDMIVTPDGMMVPKLQWVSDLGFTYTS